jgi:integrase
MADATDLKSVDPKGSCGFESRHRHRDFRREKASGLGPEAFFLVLLALQGFAGLRRSEVEQIEWDDIKFDTERIVPTKTKSGKMEIHHYAAKP